MKKLLSFVLVLLLIVGLCTALVSCGKDEEEDVISPDTDYKTAYGYLRDAGFDVDLNDDAEDLSDFGIEGLVARVQGETDVDDPKDLEIVVILYFESADALKSEENMVDAYLGRLKMQASSLGLNVTTGKSGSMAWLGTENAIKIASGIKVDINVGGIVEDRPGGGNGETLLPSDDANAALESLLSKGYTAEINSSESYLEGLGIDGVVAVLVADRVETKDTIFIFYFESEDALGASEAVIDERLGILRESAESEGFSVASGRCNFIAWIGTSGAISDTHN